MSCGPFHEVEQVCGGFGVKRASDWDAREPWRLSKLWARSVLWGRPAWAGKDQLRPLPHRVIDITQRARHEVSSKRVHTVSTKPGHSELLLVLPQSCQQNLGMVLIRMGSSASHLYMKIVKFAAS